MEQVEDVTASSRRVLTNRLNKRPVISTFSVSYQGREKSCGDRVTQWMAAIAFLRGNGAFED
jgi:hypothetical protein